MMAMKPIRGMMQRVLGLLLALSAHFEPASAQNSTIFAGVELPSGDLAYASSARVIVQGAKIVGARSPFESVMSVEFSASAREVTYQRTAGPPDLCRGCCATPIAFYQFWLELEPDPGAGPCPGLQCRVSVSVEFTPVDRRTLAPRAESMKLADFKLSNPVVARKAAREQPPDCPLAPLVRP